MTLLLPSPPPPFTSSKTGARQKTPKEYALAATAFSLGEAALIDLAEGAAACAFVGDGERAALAARVRAFREAWQQRAAAAAAAGGDVGGRGGGGGGVVKEGGGRVR